MSDTADLDVQAREMGWRPKEEFRGDPEKWVSAEEFVRRGETVMPLLKAQNGKLKTEIDGLKGKVSTLESTVAAAQEALTEFRKYHDETSKQAYEKALRDLRKQREEARQAGEVDQVVEIESAIDDLKSKAPTPKPVAPAPAPTPAIHPDVVAWEEDNSMWLSDPAKKAYAQHVAGYVRAMHGDLTGRAFLDKVTAEVEKHFGGPAPKADSVEGTGREPGGRRRTFSDLPSEAKAACDRVGARLVGPGRAFKTLDDWRVQYVKDYAWE